MFTYSRLSEHRIVKNQKQILYSILAGLTFLVLSVTLICIVILSPESQQNDETKVNNTKGEVERLHGDLLMEDGRDTDPIAAKRRDKIRSMAEFAWTNYKKYAWGENELKPVSRSGHDAAFGDRKLGSTIVDSLDALYIMNLKEQYQEGRDWVAQNFSLKDKTGFISVFETNIRFMGGFLTMYTLTKDPMYKDKAQEVGDILLPAFSTDTGIPRSIVDIQTGSSKNHPWTGSNSILSEVGALHLEFAYLSDITGDPKYRDAVMKCRAFLKSIPKMSGLYPIYINPETGDFKSRKMSMGAFGDTLYEYLLKMWIQSNKTDQDARDMYDEAIDAVADILIHTSPSGLQYVTELSFDEHEHVMDHLACFAGGLFALGADTEQNHNSERYMAIGKEITNTCHQSYIRSTTHLGPGRFRFDQGLEAKAATYDDRRFSLRPEVIESYFVLWRLTHDQKYRDWGWDAVEAIEKYCKTPTGYSGIKDVYSTTSEKDDIQQSFFIAEVLKYLYLLYSDDSLLSLNEWVFNTEAHPLPIRGSPMFQQALPRNNTTH